MPTLEQLFTEEKITKDKIETIQDETDYWASAGQFILDWWKSVVERLSPKQRNWALKILEDLVERRIERGL